MKLRIADHLSLDLLRLVDSRMLINANSGGGKSYLLRLIAERACEHVQTIILDPEGEFVTLREKFDFILVGEQGEIPCEVRSAALLARKLLELQANAVIDLYDLKLPERRRFVKLFLESLMHLPKTLWHPCLIMLDEAHLFCPEHASGQAESTNAVIDLMSQGRKRSYCGILATQRLSKLHKDAEAETNNVVIGRTWLDVDQKRASALLGFGKEKHGELRDREPGSFYGFGPAFSQQGVITFKADAVQTTHPKPGQRHKLTPPKPSEAVKRIVADLADLPQQAEAEIRDLTEAKKKIAELQREIRQRPKEQVTETKVEYIEVPVLKNGQLDKALKLRDGLQAIVAPLVEAIGKATNAPSPKPPAPSRPSTPATVAPKPVIPGPRRQVETSPATSNDNGELNGPEQRILDALAWLESIGVMQPENTAVAFLAGYTADGGAYNNPRGSLRTKGLIEYTSGGCLMLTDAGRAKANAPGAPLTTAELHEAVLRRLPGPEQKLLRVLLEAYPNDLSNEELAEAAGYQAGGGAFNNPKGRLRTLGLAEYPAPQRVRARSILFLE